MINLGIVGMGHIFAKQLEALDALKDRLRLAAVCDSDAVKAYRGDMTAMPPDVSRYTEIESLLRDSDVDAVLISTPPATHYQLASKALTAGKNVLLEKPATLDLSELEALYRMAQEHHVLLHIAFHASFAKDLFWFLSHKDEWVSGPPSVIECGFYDPYMADGKVIDERRILGGCYIDSGVNALSVCGRLVDPGQYRLVTKDESADAQGTVFHSDRVFACDSGRIVIHTAWDKGLNQKYTVLSYNADAVTVELDHSNQEVRVVQGDESRVVYRYTEGERLFTHYCGVFKDFCRAVQLNKDNRDVAMAIHRLLLQ